MSLQEESIFNEALDIADPIAREQFLDRVCASDDSLRQRVIRLLTVYAKGALLEPMSNSHSSSILHSTAPYTAGEKLGESIGPYVLHERIGEGGMGSVYLADQLHPVRRKVALKIIKAGMDTGQVVARFEAERQALAMMNHPNIAKVLDAGATASGRPYFVMELVHGIPVTEYCNQYQVTLPQRMELLVQICDAVHHAHQKGIIHRDLKPSNLLVELHEGRGLPKVIDFGVAKATGQPLTERTLVTHFSQVIGTPLYMSPEQSQLSDLDIDVRSDVYSLGVLLFELLTGTTPVALDSLGRLTQEEALRRIRDVEAPRPSARVSTLAAETLKTLADNLGVDPIRIAPRLRGELDWITVKALEKDRCRRYQSAQEFSQDIQRYLDGEPVNAHPPSWFYRATKFAARHRVGLTISGLLLASLIAASFVIGTSLYFVARERQTLHYERLLSQQQRDVLLENERIASSHRYTVDIRLAWQAWGRMDVPLVREYLSKWKPTDDATDLRGFEWHYLNRLAETIPKPIGRHAGPSYFAAFSPDDNLLATAGADGLRVWDTKNARELKYFPNANGDAQWICFSQSGKRMVAAVGKTVLMWDTASWTLLNEFRCQYFALAAEFLPDNETLLIAEREEGVPNAHRNIVRTINIETGSELWRHHDSDGWMQSLAISSASELVALAYASGKLTLLNLNSGSVERSQNMSVDLMSLASSSDGRYLAVGGVEGLIQILQFDNLQAEPIAIVQTADTGIESLQFCEGDSVLLAAGGDGRIRGWDIEVHSEQLATTPRFDFRLAAKLWCARLDNHGAHLAGTDGVGDVHVLDFHNLPKQNADTREGQLFPTMPPDEKRRFASGSSLCDLSQDGTVAAVLTPDFDVQFWNLENNQMLSQIPIADLHALKPQARKDSQPSRIRFIPGQRNAIVEFGRRSLVLDATSGQPLPQIGILENTDHENIEFQPAGEIMAVRLGAGGANTGVIINRKRNTIAHQFGDGVFDHVWTPDGRSIVTQWHSREVVVWKTQNWKERMRFLADGPMDISPDGLTLATLAKAEILLWNLVTCRELLRIPLDQPMQGVRFTSDGSELVTEARTQSGLKQWVWSLCRD